MARRTLSLDLVTLRKSEEGGKKVVVIGRHCIVDTEKDEECNGTDGRIKRCGTVVGCLSAGD